MSAHAPISTEAVVDQPIRAQFEVFLDQHRVALHDCLDGLTEEQARRSPVPSRTTCGHADILREQILAG